jgi:hypothetical protein
MTRQLNRLARTALFAASLASIGWSQTVAYCTSGVTASGCQAVLSTTGTPSASAASGFFVTGSALEGSKLGRTFFGFNGRAATPWGLGSNCTSYWCVKPPTQRGPSATNSGTQGACDGVQTLDWNAWWTAKPHIRPIAGVVVQMQMWHRDPSSACNAINPIYHTTGMTHAIEFTMAP